MSEEKKIIKALLFYAELLSNRKNAKEFHEELDKLGLAYDYFFSTIDKAREIIK